MPVKSKSATVDTPYRTNPSAISRYFFHDCERFLRYTAANATQRKLDKIPAKVFDQSPLMKAILDSGYSWEQIVLEKHLKEKAKVAPGKGEIHTRRFDWGDTLKLLRTAKLGTFIYQPTLRTPAVFYSRYGIDPALVTLSDNHPDLIAVIADGAGKRLLRVLDVKRGEALKLTHRVQILLYALQLADIVAEQDIDDVRVDLMQGGVWLGGQSEPTVFDLDDFRPHLENFLRDELMRVLQAEIGDVRWHLYFRCEWCEFFEHCQSEMRSKNDVSRLAYLTTYGKRHLNDEAGVRTLPQLGKFLKRADADTILSGCASLAGQRPHLTKQLAALQNGDPELHGASSPALPRGENISLYLTLQEEPLGQSIYLAGLLVRARADVRAKVFSRDVLSKIQRADGRLRPFVLLAPTPEDVEKVQAQWIILLHKMLLQVDRYNRDHSEWRDQLSLQAYVHNEREKALLIALLIDALRKPHLAEQAMALLFHFQAPELMIAERHPSSEVPYPVVVLLNALGRLLALPVDVSYTLPETLQALGSSFNYTRNDYFHFPLGHGLRAEAIHSAWHRGRKDVLPEIQKRAGLHLYAVSALLQAIRDHAGECLFAWPPKFELPGADIVGDELLSRLAFFARYESLLRCLAIRDARSESQETQVLLGRVLELRASNESVMDVAGEGTMEIDDGGFPQWLLVDDDEDGRRTQLEYRDYLWRARAWGGNSHPNRAVVGIQAVQTDELGFPTQLTVAYTKPFADAQPEEGDRLLLYQRFTDYTTDRVVAFLRDHVTSDSLFLRMLRDPVKAATRNTLPKPVEEAASKQEKALGLTPSQRDAYRKIRRRKFVPVWGPPGTGKTHFLASMILGLTAAHARARKPFRVLVTAFTHAAIENVLRKIAELQLQLDLAKELRLGKAKYWQGSQLATASIVDERDIPTWLTEHNHVVLGSTVYSCLKRYDEIDAVDLVVVDEASQVRVPESAVPMGLVAPKGRVVLAGDHLQLPPIIAGAYPEAPPGEPVLHRSIFEAVCPPPDDSSDLLSQLTENFRMNDVLTSFAATLLYGPGYKCVNKDVEERRLNLSVPKGGDPLIKACLDPTFPLVIVTLDGVHAAKENVVEAQLVAELVDVLRKRLRTEKGTLYKDDALFFRDGVFVVSPHRLQIRTIQRTLHEIRDWDHTPFVDTVDKMQGQEADAVIVSYGVADPEFAMQEADFIYGLNRLNVAITRSKAKCVVCLPRPLLNATPHVLDQPEAARGLAFMRQLVSQVAASGEEIVFDCGDGVEATVYRSDSCIT